MDTAYIRTNCIIRFFFSKYIAAIAIDASIREEADRISKSWAVDILFISFEASACFSAKKQTRHDNTAYRYAQPHRKAAGKHIHSSEQYTDCQDEYRVNVDHSLCNIYTLHFLSPFTLSDLYTVYHKKNQTASGNVYFFLFLFNELKKFSQLHPKK